MADFFIQLEKDQYFAGDTINGYIYLNVHTNIPSAQGLSLKFTGYECVKWLNARQLHRPRPNPNRPKNAPPPYDPIAAIPPKELFTQKTDTIAISSVQSEDNRDADHRPKYIKTPSNRYFQMSYHEKRNLFTKNKSMVYNCQGLPAGQYSFPFCFKTFEGWPASFEHKTQQKKGVIVYHMTVAIESNDSRVQLKHGQQVTLRQTRWLESKSKKTQAEITSCCCFSKGNSMAEVHFEKDGYMPGEEVRVIVEVDNSLCTADISSIWVSVDYTVRMEAEGSSTSDRGNITKSSMPGVLGQQSATGNNALRESFNLTSKREIKPTCSGKLLSNQYSISVRFAHNISCDCCSDHLGVSIPVIIFPVIRTYNMPSVFQSGWSPQVMPQTDMALMNNFQNQNLAQMQGYGYQQQQVYPQQGYNNQEQTMQSMQ